EEREREAATERGNYYAERGTSESYPREAEGDSRAHFSKRGVLRRRGTRRSRTGARRRGVEATRRRRTERSGATGVRSEAGGGNDEETYFSCFCCGGTKQQKQASPEGARREKTKFFRASFNWSTI